MAKAKKQSKPVKSSKKVATKKQPLVKRLLSAIGKGFSKVTKPITNSRIWKFLRRTILRSPFGGYFINAWRELKNVTWPTRRQAWKLTFVVILFSAIFTAFTSSLDYGFEQLVERIFLN